MFWVVGGMDVVWFVCVRCLGGHWKNFPVAILAQATHTLVQITRPLPPYVISHKCCRLAVQSGGDVNLLKLCLGLWHSTFRNPGRKVSVILSRIFLGAFVSRWEMH